MSRIIGYRWNLRLRMAERGMFATTDLVPLLAERGVVLSREQVYRLVVGTPERLSLRIFAALCDILGCGPGDLVEPVAERQPDSRRTAGDVMAPPPSATLSRPKRARITPDAQDGR
jgi:DNA-binding Xre family transcriptional regulator